MSGNSRAWRSVAALVLVVLLACACGSGGPLTAKRLAAAPRSTPSADAYTCASVQALLGHLAVATDHWSPTQHPFDKAMATQIHSTSVSLQKSLQQVQTVVVERAISASAKAFGAVATAMTQKNRAQVHRAITQTQLAFKSLKRACGAA